MVGIGYVQSQTAVFVHIYSKWHTLELYNIVVVQFLP